MSANACEESCETTAFAWDKCASILMHDWFIMLIMKSAKVPLPLVLWRQSRRVSKGTVPLAVVSTTGQWPKLSLAFLCLCLQPHATCNTLCWICSVGWTNGIEACHSSSQQVVICAVYPSDREIHYTRRPKWEFHDVPTLDRKPEALIRSVKNYFMLENVFTVHSAYVVSQTPHWIIGHSLV